MRAFCSAIVRRAASSSERNFESSSSFADDAMQTLSANTGRKIVKCGLRQMKNAVIKYEIYCSQIQTRETAEKEAQEKRELQDKVDKILSMVKAVGEGDLSQSVSVRGSDRIAKLLPRSR